MATLSNSRINHRNVVTAKRGALLNQDFYFFMSLLVAAVVIYGFSFTIEKNLLHSARPRPFLLYIHG